MKQTHLIAYNCLLLCCLFVSSIQAQTTKTHTERFIVKDGVNIHVNTSHANVVFETWDKDEVKVTFTLESDENIEEHFKDWKYEATGNSSKITINSQSAVTLFPGGQSFNFDFGDYEFTPLKLDYDFGNLKLDNLDGLISDVMGGLNLEELPTSPFGKDINFNGDKYRKDPEAYLKKLNEKNGTQVTQQEVDKWLDDLKNWADNIDVKIDPSTQSYLFEIEDKVSKQSKIIEKYVEEWQDVNEDKIKEMTDKIAKQFEGKDWSSYNEFNLFDQDRSKVKKTIRIKLPKSAKLHLNIRYGEVTLAENLRNINADLNYAALSANSIKGKDTDISSAFAPVLVNHWYDGRLYLNHCKDIAIKKINQIELNAQGTDVVIGTLFDSGSIRSAYGDLEIKEMGEDLKNLQVFLDYGSAKIYLPSFALDVNYVGNSQSYVSFPNNLTIISDKKKGKQRLIEAYKQQVNSGKRLSILANYGELAIK